MGLRHLVRRMGRGECQVQEERSGRIMPIDQLDRVAPKEISDIALLLRRLAVAKPVPDAVGGVGEVVDLAKQRPVLVVEPAP
jgi:hypothetical protein